MVFQKAAFLPPADKRRLPENQARERYTLFMKFATYFLILVISISSCSNSNNTKIARQGDSEEYLLNATDIEMNNAIKMARQTFGNFTNALKNPKKEQSYFAVKVPFNYDKGTEHLWLVDISIDSNVFFGTVNNEPEFTKEVKCDQRIEFNPDSISDWKYIENNKLIGGYTIKVIYNRLSTEEQIQFKKDYGFSPE
jgi:uncharacterized protein YegJ (DUF2314 family)